MARRDWWPCGAPRVHAALLLRIVLLLFLVLPVSAGTEEATEPVP